MKESNIWKKFLTCHWLNSQKLSWNYEITLSSFVYFLSICAYMNVLCVQYNAWAPLCGSLDAGISEGVLGTVNYSEKVQSLLLCSFFVF